MTWRLQKTSMLSAFPLWRPAHLSQVPALRKRLDAGKGRHIELVVGGVIPPGDVTALTAAGAAAVFPPGTRSTDAASRLLDLLARRRNIQARA